MHLDQPSALDMRFAPPSPRARVVGRSGRGPSCLAGGSCAVRGHAYALAVCGVLVAQLGWTRDAEAQAVAAEAEFDGVQGDLDDRVVPELADPNPTSAAVPPPPAGSTTGAALTQPEDEFTDVERLLDRADATWVLDDGVGIEEVPWDAYDPVTDYQPREGFTTGFSFRAAALPFGDSPALDGPLLELGYLLDYRVAPRSAWHLRAILAIAYQPHYNAYLGGGYFRYTSPFAVKLRLVPIAFDLGNLFTVRVGGEVGIQWVENPDNGAGAGEVLGGASGELCLRVFDGRFEVGVVAGFQLTAIGEVNRFEGYHTYLTAEMVLGGTLQALLP